MMWERQPSKVISSGAAISLWRLYGFSTPRELVLEDLALAMGILVVEAKLDKADARLIRRGPRGLIRVKHDIPEPGRKRFAIAHELGHWALHRKSQIDACTDQNMVAKYKASAAEVEANYFAAELLMPKDLFTPRIRCTRPSFGLISALADEFGTSLTAAAIQYTEVSDDYCAIVVSEDGRIRWWRGSEQFEQRFWIEAGTLLSPESIAGSLFNGEPSPPGPEEVESQAWAECREGYEHDLLIEEAFPLETYNQVLSLLYLP